MQQIELNAVYQAEPLHDSTVYLLGIEAAAPLPRFCGTDEKAVKCRREANKRSGGRADLLHQAVVAYRGALDAGSSDGIHRPSDIGSALSHEAKSQPRAGKAAMLEGALKEYDQVIGRPLGWRMELVPAEPRLDPATIGRPQ